MNIDDMLVRMFPPENPSIGYWENVLKEKYGLSARLTRFDGEFDLNFRAHTHDGKRFILKVMRRDCDPGFVKMQTQAITRIRRSAPELPVPNIIRSLEGNRYCTARDETDNWRILWLLESLDGVPFADFHARTPALLRQLGVMLGRMGRALEDFSHGILDRPFKWNLARGDWIGEHLASIPKPRRRTLLADICERFAEIKPQLLELPRQALHNDLNDHNILVRPSHTSEPEISGILDFGDMTLAPAVCDLAIAAAYAVLDRDKPETELAELVAGYHSERPLSTHEIDLIHPLIEMRLAVSVVNSTLMSRENPDDKYVVVSQAPAWHFIERSNMRSGLLAARLRVACGHPATNSAPGILEYLEEKRGSFDPVIRRDLADAPTIDLSVSGSIIPENPFNPTIEEAAQVGARPSASPVAIGRYAEPRLLRGSHGVDTGPNANIDVRTVHLGINIFAAAGEAVHAPINGVVISSCIRKTSFGYGGVVVLGHRTPDNREFRTLFGHLELEGASSLKAGRRIAGGEQFAKLGSCDRNGGWDPNLFFQLVLADNEFGDTPPSFANPDDLGFLRELFPNPAPILNLANDSVEFIAIDERATERKRSKIFGKNLKLSYRNPVMFVRGWRHHLFDQMGGRYLDAYNNVPHVGHAHPRIRAVASDQLGRMNSNTRYLHPAQTDFAEKLLSKMPDGLNVCYFVNSGTEANELALRLARAHTGGFDMITPNHGYHGNTTGAIDISAYKFNKPGGSGKRDWVHLIDIADDYRGRFRRDDPNRAQKYAAQVDDALREISTRGGRLAGFIAETFPSVGGQIIPPDGYLERVYQKVRSAGGVCIADEVQTGLGRLGSHYFGFEHQRVVPDMVVLGKPLGNGHPIGAVITTRGIAESFANGIEFFSTFGGSNLSCRIGKEVLDIVDEELLQDNARKMGLMLLRGLRDLQSRFEIIGDIRGFGLFSGVELSVDRSTREPATEIAEFVVNRMRERKVLIGLEGSDENVLKIRPPLTIGAADIDRLLTYLGKSLAEI